MTSAASERLCVALDFPEREAALRMAEKLRGRAGWFKVGLELFVAEGPGVVTELLRFGRIFLDLKFHDIPNTVAAAVGQVARLGVAMLNVHASGGREMIARAVEVSRHAAAGAGVSAPKVVAVTVLTSLDVSGLSQLLFSGSPREVVLHLARLSEEAGADGVVCSPAEVEAIRGQAKAGFLTVVPGIRPERGSVVGEAQSADDQRRIATPAAAIRAGSDLLVVGRPITGAEDPCAAADFVIAEMERSIKL